MRVTRNLAKRIGIASLLGFACGMTYAQDLGSLVIAKQGYFFVGGKYIAELTVQQRMVLF